MATQAMNIQNIAGIPQSRNASLTKIKDMVSTITEFFGMCFVTHVGIVVMEPDFRSKLLVHERSQLDCSLLGIG